MIARANEICFAIYSLQFPLLLEKYHSLEKYLLSCIKTNFASVALISCLNYKNMQREIFQQNSGGLTVTHYILVHTLSLL